MIAIYDLDDGQIRSSSPSTSRLKFKAAKQLLTLRLIYPSPFPCSFSKLKNDSNSGTNPDAVSVICISFKKVNLSFIMAMLSIIPVSFSTF